jgi:hypothetical protein
MLPLDHLPFRANDLATLQAGFGALGFTLSPPGAYTSADVPEARWPNRSVFLNKGWFDLLLDPAAEPATIQAPGGALFRTDDLDAALEAVGDMRCRPAYRLERRWDVEIGLPPETFRLFDLRERVAPIGLAVIEHAWPCADILPAWLEHENGALEIAGLIFGGATPGPMADRAGALLGLSAFEYVAVDDFEMRFGACPRQIAVRVRVASLARAMRVLSDQGVAWEAHGDTACVGLQRGFGCGFLFFE